MVLKMFRIEPNKANLLLLHKEGVVLKMLTANKVRGKNLLTPNLSVVPKGKPLK